MRMKLNKSGQLLLVSAASLLVAGLVTACSSTLTTDFVFVTSAKAAGPYNYGEIDVFEINSESGFMRQIPTSPFPSGGRNPVAEALSSDNQNLYVVNQDDNTIVQFVIGSDGKLYPQNTVNTPGIFPMAVAVSGSNLFVVDTFQPLPTCSSAAPCSGSVAVYPIASASSNITDGTLGSPVANGSVTYWPLCLSGYMSQTNNSSCKSNGSTDIIVPTALNVLASGASQFLYVTAYDSTVSPTAGYVFGFSVASSGVLTPLNGGVPFSAGVHPSAIASASSGNVYVTDFVDGNILGYSVNAGSLAPLSGSPFPAGDQPSSIAVDTKYNYAYVANSLDSTVTAYSITSGALTRVGTFATGVQPVAIGIDPSTSHFVFTVNFLGNNVSGFELNPVDGTLINSQNTPYTANAQPTAVVAIPHNQ